jgi:beta propeller repeat protein
MSRGLRQSTELVSIVVAFVLFGCLVTNCSGCSESSGKPTEESSGNTADSDGSTVSTGSESPDSDTPNETSTETDTVAVDSWEWQDNPEGEDCGPGCRQATFERNVGEEQWDVWENLLVYSDTWRRIQVVDLSNNRSVQVPDVYPEHPSRPDSSSESSSNYPTIYEWFVYYTHAAATEPPMLEVIQVDLKNQSQQIIWQREIMTEDDLLRYHVPAYLDVYGERVVSEAGAGNPLFVTLSVFEPPWPTEGRTLIDERNYGGFNSIWEDTLIFWELNSGVENISGYDFTKEEFFSVTDDEEYQFAPRMHKNRVVYMDLRLGESNTRGDWEHGAIFMKDLSTGETTQITSGETLAANPDIHDDIIVWMDYRACDNPNNKDDHQNIEIWGYDLSTQTEFQITDLPGWPKGFPRVWKDKVYVHMFRELAAGDAIYQFDLPEH